MTGNATERLAVSPSLAKDLCGDDPGAAAHALASLGIPVFPTHTALAGGGCSCGRDCGRDAGKHPRTRNGLQDATCDPEQIGAWWTRWPTANIAIATGVASGIWALDIDAQSGGLDSIDRLEAEHGQAPPTWAVESGGGGLHLWFRHPDMPVPTTASRIGVGLDVRGDGGYLIAPPSRHRSGQPYRWGGDAWHPANVELAFAPPWLLGLAVAGPVRSLVPPGRFPQSGEAGGNDGAAPVPIAEGQRNDALARLAGAMRRRGFGESAILAALLAENADRCVPPLAEADVARIARSIGRYVPAYDAAGPPRGPAARPRAGGFVEFVNGKAVLR
jgi:putative DNA primase/helicase